MHLNQNLQTTSNMISPSRTFSHPQNKKPKFLQWPKGHDFTILLTFLVSSLLLSPLFTYPLQSRYFWFALQTHQAYLYPRAFAFAVPSPWNDFPPDIFMASSSKSLLKYHLLSKTFPRYLLWAKSHKIHMLKSKPPWPQNVTIFGERVFKWVIKLKWGHLGEDYSHKKRQLVPS